MQQGLGFGLHASESETLHIVARSRCVQLFETELGQPIPQPESGEELVLTMQLNLRSCGLGGGHERGEVHVCGDVGFARLVEGMWAEMMCPIGAKGPVLTTWEQVLGGVAVVDEDDRARLHTLKHVYEPRLSVELCLDPAPFSDLARVRRKPVE